MRRGTGIRGLRSILRFLRWLMWGVGIQKNLFNGKFEVAFQLLGISEQLKKHLEYLTEKERSVCKCNYGTQKFLLGRYIVEQEQQGTVKMLRE